MTDSKAMGGIIYHPISPEFTRFVTLIAVATLCRSYYTRFDWA